MRSFNRRAFLAKSTVAAGAMALTAPFSRVLGANDDLRVAVIGCGGQGRYHINCLRDLKGVRVTAVCDPDRDVLDRLRKDFASRNEKVETFTDLRKLFETASVDAITTATPDHWHALVTIWACQAGKDVYCEKPLSHNLWEGRQMVNAARKYNRIVQFGNQNHGVPTGEMRLELESIGKIRVAYAALNRMRESIGKLASAPPIPASIDFDLWAGPSPLVPPRRTKFHYDWHWVWSTGTGELGNNGIYQLDECRLALGQRTLPKRVLCMGGRFLFNDDGETPNSQLALFQYDPGPLVIFELRNFPSEKGPKTIGRKVRGERGEADLPRPPGTPGNTGGFARHTGHMFNFFETVRSRQTSGQRSDVLEGHLSTSLVHMANISYRLGTPQTLGAAREAIQDRGPEAIEAFGRFQQHLEANGVDFAKSQMIVGPWLEMDAVKEQFVGSSPETEGANRLLRGSYRQPFVVPEIA
jgi:predicted dehydrogenase